jgi:asparagine N-glycosylation enzyme membrane subunit Stt3
MEQPKMWMIFITGLIPIIVGFIWYSKALFGNAWMKAAGLDEEKMKKANMPVMLLLSYVFGVMIAFPLMFLVIHQMSLFSIVANENMQDKSSEAYQMVSAFMAKYGRNFRTFKHGAFHGTISAVFFAMPVLGISALFERRGAKYIFIHLGFWVITLALMGGILCAFM